MLSHQTLNVLPFQNLLTNRRSIPLTTMISGAFTFLRHALVFSNVFMWPYQSISLASMKVWLDSWMLQLLLDN